MLRYPVFTPAAPGRVPTPPSTAAATPLALWVVLAAMEIYTVKAMESTRPHSALRSSTTALAAEPASKSSATTTRNGATRVAHPF